MVGDTGDTSLTGISSYLPYVAIHSIEIARKIYWAKAFNTYNPFFGVKFSTDGKLLIAHSSISDSFIVVFNTSNGDVLSARKYSEGGVSNYHDFINSLLLSSGPLPTAYVLSNYNM